jgi:xanthine dehydrogenase YagR molybdenum-binding subunit
MEMTGPVPPNAIDENRHGHIGEPMDRVDGVPKATGAAPYAYEVREGDAPAYGWIVEASIARGRIQALDLGPAQGSPGVMMVLSHLDMPPQGQYSTEVKQRFRRAVPYLGDDRIIAYGEPVALVVAETLEQARAAAALVKPEFEPVPGEFGLDPARAEKPSDNVNEPDTDVGDFDAGFALSDVKVDVTYTTPFHIHAQMEPHATLAWWEGDRVVIHCSTQMIEHAQARVAATLQIPLDKVRIVSRYIGGGFGGKLPVFADVILSAQASRKLGRPVKTALTRQQMFHITTHRSRTVQRVRLGASKDGVLQAIGHEALSHSARYDDFFETAAAQTRTLYAAPDRMTRHRVNRLDLPRADSCRAPGEAVGMLALECAMDELAHELGLDPVELRLRNEPEIDPEKKVPYSTRHLVQCLREGARRFGWERRNPRPGQVREGRWLIGHGMCATTRSNYLQKAQCELTLNGTGVLTARMAMTDIGTGSYTILTQIAAEMFGLPPRQVRIELGDSDFAQTSGSGGSFGAATSGSALYDACEKLRAALAHSAGIDPAQAEFADGQIRGGGKSAHLAKLAHDGGITVHGEIQSGDMTERYSQQAYGAQFAEVAVDGESGEVRLRRMLGVFAAGRLLNAKLARSQVLGGMIWGVGYALLEEGALDPRHGFFANHDLAEYHVPVHADIPDIEVVFLPEVDDKANPLKIKGVGELGISGAGAAVANAIFNATGVRLRDYPMTLDKVLAGLP